jgi:hypothetical protein
MRFRLSAAVSPARIALAVPVVLKSGAGSARAFSACTEHKIPGKPVKLFFGIYAK